MTLITEVPGFQNREEESLLSLKTIINTTVNKVWSDNYEAYTQEPAFTASVAQAIQTELEHHPVEVDGPRVEVSRKTFPIAAAAQWKSARGRTCISRWCAAIMNFQSARECWFRQRWASHCGYLSAGHNRQAVQEILWLLETVSMVFQGAPVGDTTVQGKYFNKIAAELRHQRKGQVAEQAINWMKTFHGYLSSPTGGGVRHGGTLSTESEMSPHEARLFCNLIRSYLNFLLDECDSLKRGGHT